MHQVIQRGNVAVITGGASGIGLEAARQCLRSGLKVCIADQSDASLQNASTTLANDNLLLQHTDVSDAAKLQQLVEKVFATFGGVDLLLNNAGIQPGSTIFDEDGHWQRIIDVNLWGIIRCAQAFAPRMLQSGRSGLIINTGSKQGITTPPGDPAYNVAKAGVKVFTEALQHELRNRPGGLVEARLFIPGFVHTPLTAGNRTEKPTAAWTPEQVVDFLFESLERDDFYILCPDNDVDRRTDERRIAWAAGDIIENRPPLSRWHPDYADAFAASLDSPDQ